MKRPRDFVFFLSLFLFSAALMAQQPAPDLLLRGKIVASQIHTDIEVPFDVPAGVHRISVDFRYSGQDQRTALGIGIADPNGFRGNSANYKSHFTIGESDATPSYLPGAILPGKWKLLVAVPNIRPNVVSEYTAEIRFNSRVEDQSFTLVPLERGKRWYRGDLHMHTGHSDGTCRSQSGVNVPCPLFLTLQSAAAHGLDFVAVTDHNTDSHYNEMRADQPYFDRLLLIPGREITTFYGHLNVFGFTQFVDWRVTKGEQLNALLREVHAKGGIASVNHALRPESEDCLGCQWLAPEGTDSSLLDAIEVVNGSDAVSNASFWDGLLRQGDHLPAVGGSDSHNGPAYPATEHAIGWPATVVEADNLSVSAIVKGIHSGRTFVDRTSARDTLLDYTADAEGRSARMGDTVEISSTAEVHLTIHAVAVEHSLVHLFVDGTESSSFTPVALSAYDSTVSTTLRPGPGKHWVRAEVRDASGALQLVGSPLYIHAASQGVFVQ